MTATEAYQKFPMLEGMGVLDLVVLRHGAVTTKDDKVKEAIDAILKQKEKEL